MLRPVVLLTPCLLAACLLAACTATPETGSPRPSGDATVERAMPPPAIRADDLRATLDQIQVLREGWQAQLATLETKGCAADRAKAIRSRAKNLDNRLGAYADHLQHALAAGTVAVGLLENVQAVLDEQRRAQREGWTMLAGCAA